MARCVEEVEKIIAYYQHTNAQIAQELVEADRLLRKVGFEDGLETVKSAALEIIHMRKDASEIS